jgi:hypothetical protein
MAEFTQVTTQDLWVDGQSMTIKSQLINDTLVLTWTLPPAPMVYDGAVVVVGTVPQAATEQPIDGTRYSASSNYGVPAPSNGMIGNAQVVAAFYGYFGDNIQQTSVTVSNVDPSQIYYATIYPCSNILQYYSIGVQSYPLSSGPKVQNVSPYAGSIPTAFAPPENPSAGDAYYDPSTNSVFIYDGTQQAWAKSLQATVKSGDEIPIQKYQLWFQAFSKTLYFFDGTQWVKADSTNLRVKMGSTWAAYAGATQYGSPAVGDPSPSTGGAIWAGSFDLSFDIGEAQGVFPATPPPTGTFALVTQQAAISAPPISSLWFVSLGQWFMPTADLVQVLVNGQWNNIVEPSTTSGFGVFLPALPKVGDFFYNTASKRLLAWDGSSYVAIDKAQRGTPLTQKDGIGTSGVSDIRTGLATTLMNMLGYPSVCVELKPSNFDIAISRALSKFRQRADNGYKPAFIAFTVRGNSTGGQSVYYLNDPRDKTDKIVNVIRIHRINQLGIASLSADTGLYAQAFFNQLYQGSNVDVVSIHLMAQLSKLYEKIFAGNLVFTWDESKRELVILRRFLQAEERVILEVVMEREDDELITDRWCGIWIQDWARAELLEMLGNIRSKYGTLPGAQGALSLNGDSLLAQAAELKTELQRQINDYEVGNGGLEWQNTAFFEG